MANLLFSEAVDAVGPDNAVVITCLGEPRNISLKFNMASYQLENILSHFETVYQKLCLHLYPKENVILLLTL